GPLGIFSLRDQGKIRSALIVDTDAHQGNGTADAIHSLPWAASLDFYEDDLFPFPKSTEEMPVPLRPGLAGASYLDILREHLHLALDRFRPDFVLYNAGSDVLRTDPLAHFLLAPEEMPERDLYVVSEVRRRNIPIAMVPSGGYGPASWQAHADSIEGIL